MSAAEDAPGRTPPGVPLLDLRLVPAALVAWGAAAAGVLVPTPVAPWIVAAGILTLVCALGVGLRGRVRTPGVGLLVLVCLVAGIAAFTSAAGQVALRGAGPLESLAQERAVATLAGTVVGDPRAWTPRPAFGQEDDPGAASRTGWLVTLSVRAIDARGEVHGAAGTVVVLGAGAWGDVAPGSEVHAMGRLGPTDPGDDAVALLHASVAPDVVAPPGASSTLVTRMRHGVRAASAHLPPDQAGLVPGIAVGDTSALPPDLDAAMRTTSLVHITAVSGGHFAIIGATVLGLAVLVGLRRWPRALLTAAAMTGFVVLVGPDPAVLRAAAMGAIGVLALVLGRPSAALPALSTAIVVLVVIDPWTARSVGFVLSVVATAGLVLGARPLARGLGRIMPGWLAHALAVPIAAQAACAPVLVLLEPVVATYAVPANLLAAPAMVPATVLGCLAAVISPLWPAGAALLATGAGWGAWWIAEVARFGAGLPGSALPWPAGGGGAALLAGATAVITVLGVLLARHGRATPKPVAAGLVVLLVVGLGVAVPALRDTLGRRWPAVAATGPWTVAACDVGQGDMLVVRAGPEQAVVVDVGPAGGGAAACLARLGVRRVELLVLSHFHADHVGGLAEVLESGVTVAEAIVSPLAEPAPQARTAHALLARARVPVRAGTVATTPGGESGGVAWDVLWPRDPGAVVASPNDSSVVVRLEVEGARVLALGDLEKDAQDALARQLERGIAADGAAPVAHVVKMAHHGSANQSARLARLIGAPVTLVGVGADNDYGHPRREALDLYGAGGGRVLRTDTCGDLVLLVADDQVWQRGPCGP